MKAASLDPGAAGQVAIVGARRGTVGRVPWGRLGRTRDVAELMLFVLSPEASFITGGAYPVDGGVMSGLGS